MSFHDRLAELVRDFLDWLVGPAQEPEPIRIPVEEEPAKRRRRD